MYCENCRTSVNAGSKFCSHCGARLNTRRRLDHPQRSPTNVIVLTSFLILVFAGLAVLIVFHSSKKEGESQRVALKETENITLVEPPTVRGVEAGIATIPPHQGYVNDFAGIISPLHQSKITEIARRLERETTAQLVVVTVASTRPESIETYAARLGNAWGLGQKGKDNGILLLAAVEDKKVRIAVGRGLERALPDAVLKKIIEEKILPHFRKGDYSSGIYAGAEAVYDHPLHSGQDRERNCYAGIWRENQLNQFRWTIELSEDGLHIERTDGFAKGTFVRSGTLWNGTLSWGNGDTWTGVVLYSANEACNEIRTNQRWWFKR